MSSHERQTVYRLIRRVERQLPPRRRRREYGDGLGPLPARVRSLPRVRRRIGAKLILHHARLLIRSNTA